MRHINFFLGAPNGVFWVGRQNVSVEKVYVILSSLLSLSVCGPCPFLHLPLLMFIGLPTYLFVGDSRVLSHETPSHRPGFSRPAEELNLACGLPTSCVE